jgi:hypothetical protein
MTHLEFALILEILKHTPPWVFGLFLGLVYLGYVQSKTRSVSRVRLAVLPAIMLCLSLLGVWSSFGADWAAFFTWAIALAGVIALGRARPALRGTAYSAEARRFIVPGSWLPFGLMMCIFFTKYAVAVARAVSGGRALPLGEILVVCAICGVCSGMFFVRALRVMKAAPST